MGSARNKASAKVKSNTPLTLDIPADTAYLGVTPRELWYLQVVAVREQTSKELQIAAGAVQSAVSHAMSGLMHKGMVVRRKTPQDFRTCIWSITDKGKALLKRV